MTDISLSFINPSGAGGALTDNGWDAAVGGGGDLTTTTTLESAVILSLFADARADERTLTDAGYLPTDDPRGWWSGIIGSRLWLFSRRKITDQVLAEINLIIRQGLQWLVDDNLINSIDVVVARGVALDHVNIRVELFRDESNEVYEYAIDRSTVRS